MASLLDMGGGPQIDQNWLAKYLGAQNTNTPQVMTPWGKPSSQDDGDDRNQASVGTATTVASAPSAPATSVQDAIKGPPGPGATAQPASSGKASAANQKRGSRNTNKTLITDEPADPNTGQTPLEKAAAQINPLFDSQTNSLKSLADIYRQMNGIDLANSSSWVKPLLALSDQQSGGHLAASDTSLSPQDIAKQMGQQADELAKRQQDISKDRASTLAAVLKSPTSTNTYIYGNPGGPNMQDPGTKLYNHTVDQLNNSRMTTPAAQQAEKDLYSAAKVNSLIQNARTKAGDTDPNVISPRMVSVLVDEVGKIASGANPTIAGTDAISPTTFKGSLARAWEKLTNSKQPADAADFIKEYQDYANDIATQARQVVTDQYGRKIEPLASQFTPEQNAQLQKTFMHRFSADQLPGSDYVDPSAAARKAALIAKLKARDAGQGK